MTKKLTRLLYAIGNNWEYMNPMWKSVIVALLLLGVYTMGVWAYRDTAVYVLHEMTRAGVAVIDWLVDRVWFSI